MDVAPDGGVYDVVIDSGSPRNGAAAAVHGLLGQEGVNPSRLLEKGRAEGSAFGAHIRAASVLEASRSSADGAPVHAAQVMQVSEAAAHGARVAMTINTETVLARARRAVSDRHSPVGV